MALYEAKSIKYKINDNWIFDTTDSSLVKNQQEKKALRAKTAEVLMLLIENHNQVVAATDFFDRVWANKYVSENVLKQSISELRSGINDCDKLLIKTVPKIGYVLRASIQPLDIDTDFQSQQSRLSSTSKVGNAAVPDNSANKASMPISHPKGTSKVLMKPRWQSLSVFLLLALTCAFGWLQYLQSARQNQSLKIQQAVLKTQSELVTEVSLAYLGRTEATQGKLISALNRILKQQQHHQDNDPKKLGTLLGLVHLYHQVGESTQARIVAKRAKELMVSLLPAGDPAHFQMHFMMMDISIDSRDRQEAYDIAQSLLSLVNSYLISPSSPEESVLQAKSYFHIARAYLFCVEPFCERAYAMEAGEHYARRALELFQSPLSVNSVLVADALVLVNWFLFAGQEKRQLMEQALSIYEKKLGDNHQKTVAALEEFGRIIAFYDNDWQTAENYLLRALQARQTLHSDGDLNIAYVQSYLGEHYFMSGDFEQAIYYLRLSMSITKAQLGKGNDKYIEQLLLLARSYLYSNNAVMAEDTTATADRLIREYDLTPSTVVTRALRTTQLRLDTYQRRKITLQELNIASSSLIETYKSPNCVIEHELQSQLLRFYPDKIDDHYLFNLRTLLNNYVPSSRYLYAVDIRWMKQRSIDDCHQHKMPFCTELAQLYDGLLSGITFTNKS